MAVAYDTARQSRADQPGPAPIRMRLPRRRRIALLVTVNLVTFTIAVFIAEAAFHLFWSPRYWIHCDRLLIGSGQTEVGKKWWPDTTYQVESSEFRVEFRTNESGYRARPTPLTADHPYRIAFVGDSFTEAMQVPYPATFCAQLEGLLNHGAAARSKVCVNFGISATDLFDYWHRIIHDVLPENPPDALVLCIFPGNDFQGLMPDDGFDPDGRPLHDYFRKPGWIKHAIAWINLHSKFGCFAQRALLSWNPGGGPRRAQGPKNWWTDPELASRNADSPAIRRCRSVFRAIDEECRRHGTKLCILVVGPVANYRAVAGQSPLARILSSWQIDVPVIDVAVKARARSDWAKLVFPFDGHLNESGHTYLAREAAEPLRTALDGDRLSTRR
jgi:hypothetical protein